MSMALVNHLVQSCAPGLSIDLFVAPGTATTGNPQDLSRLFRNLLDNAVRYARHRVLITAAARPAGVVVEIADDGPGIPEEERERVFGRFVRLDASREHTSGSAGLGLAIAGRSRPRTAPPSCSPTPRAAAPGLSSPWAARGARDDKPRPIPYTEVGQTNGSRFPRLGQPAGQERLPLCP